MAHACVSTSAYSLRFTTGFISASCHGASLDSPKLSLPFEQIRSRKTKKLVSDRKKNLSPKAVYSSTSWTPEIPSPQGLWSIRDDLQCISASGSSSSSSNVQENVCGSEDEAGRYQARASKKKEKKRQEREAQRKVTKNLYRH